MKIISKNNSKLIGVGLHLVTIGLIVLDKASKSDLYKDVTQQLVVMFENAKAQTIKRWYNLKGFQVDPDEPTRLDSEGRTVPNYAVGSNGKRIEDKDKTASALNILARLGFDAGFPEGEEFDTADLTGKTVGIMVERDIVFNANKVSYSTPASEVTEEAEIAEEVA